MSCHTPPVRGSDSRFDDGDLDNSEVNRRNLKRKASSISAKDVFDLLRESNEISIEDSNNLISVLQKDNNSVFFTLIKCLNYAQDVGTVEWMRRTKQCRSMYETALMNFREAKLRTRHHLNIIRDIAMYDRSSAVGHAGEECETDRELIEEGVIHISQRTMKFSPPSPGIPADGHTVNAFAQATTPGNDREGKQIIIIEDEDEVCIYHKHLKSSLNICYQTLCL